MTIIRNSSSEHTGKKNVRQIYSGYRINVQANQLGIPAFPTVIKGASGDIVQSLREGPIVFTPAELTAILNNNSGSTAASGPPPPPPPTPLTFTSASPPAFPYTIPASYTLITFTLIGGGGGGGGNYDFPSAGGGAGGAYIRARSSVNAGDIIRFNVGEGGAGAITDDQNKGGTGANGNHSSFIYNNTVINIFANGGNGGTPFLNGGIGEPVTGDTSLVTVLQSAPGFPGGDGVADYSNNIFTSGDGGFAGTGVAGPGAGGAGNGGPYGSGTTGNIGYWEFMLT